MSALSSSGVLQSYKRFARFTPKFCKSKAWADYSQVMRTLQVILVVMLTWSLTACLARGTEGAEESQGAGQLPSASTTRSASATPTPSARPSPTKPAASRKPKKLGPGMDDNSVAVVDGLWTCKDLLEISGYTYETASNRAWALKNYLAHCPDLRP